MAGTVLDVEPQDFVTSSGSAAATSRAIASAGSSLRSALASSSHMAGSDPAGRKWATQYDAVAADAVAGIDALDTAFGQIAAGLAVTGLNYATADWLSAGRSGHAPGYSVPWLPALACSATPPASSGGTGGSTIPGWHYVADFIGEMWPDGDTGKLRAAEAAWKAFAADLDSIRSGSASRIISDLDGTVTPEMTTITSTVTTVGSHLDKLAEEARNLGSAAGALATQIDHVHQQTEQVLVELGEQIAATAAVGIGLTIVTAGLSDAAGALAAGGEIAAAVARILGFIAELGTNVARVVDDIAVSAGSIARVAGISEQITIRVVTIAGNSVVTGLGGAVTNVGAAEIVAPGANLGDAAIEGFIGGATLGIAGGAAKYAIKSVAKLADFKIKLKVWSRRNGPDGYKLFGDLSEKEWFDKYFVGFTERGYPDWAWPAEHGFDGKMSEADCTQLRAGGSRNPIFLPRRDPGPRRCWISESGAVMNFHDLEAAVRNAGLDVRRQLSILRAPATGRTDPEVAFNVVAVDTGFEVIAGVGRGELATKPYDGYVFATESDVCDYVWRRIKTVALPHLLDEADLESNRTEAIAILARRSAGRNEPWPHGVD